MYDPSFLFQSLYISTLYMFSTPLSYSLPLSVHNFYILCLYFRLQIPPSPISFSLHFSDVYFFVFCSPIHLFVGSLFFLRHRFFIYLHGDISVTQFFSFTFYLSLSLFLILCGILNPFAYILCFLLHLSLSLLPALPKRRNFFPSHSIP
jgi:hypothetical protein